MGLYFVTICCQDNICRFGKVENGVMLLNQFGEIAHDEWVKLSERYSNALFEIFQIMPNHIHGIIEIRASAADVGATLAVAQNTPDVQNEKSVAQNGNNTGDGGIIGIEDYDVIGAGDYGVIRAGASPAPTPPAIDKNIPAMPTVGNIVGAYKSLVTNKCLEIYKSHNVYMGKLWQRDYYEHIIRNDHSFQRIIRYIENNPMNWESDRFYYP